MNWENAHTALSILFDVPEYRGYKPATREVPNGDGVVDAEKRYLHVARKYNPPAWAELFLARAHWEACKIAEQIGVPAKFMPRSEDGTLRVLEYPAGAGTAEHADFDLFTVNLWRSTPEDHEQRNDDRVWSCGAREFHMGEIGELVGLGRAVPHRVPARPYAQKALVYFAMPSHAARLPCAGPVEHEGGLCLAGTTVGEWLAERIARSRVAVGEA